MKNEVESVITWLKRHGSKRNRDGMARYAIPSDKAFGVSVGALRQLAKRLGPNHDLAAALWKTDWYEARMLATFVDEPFIKGLLLIERAASDERHFVKKAVNMALRAAGKRNAVLNAAAVAVAQRLSVSTQAAARWVGKDALRELTGPSVTRRLAAKRRARD